MGLQKAYLVQGGRRGDLYLTPAEYKLLYFFVTHESQVFKGKDLLNSIWGKSVHVVEHSVYTHIYALRKKLQTHSGYIQSIPRGGYRFVISPTLLKNHHADKK